MTKNKHSIQKVFLEIDTSSMQMANSIKDNLAVFIQNELVPILEKQFNLIENSDNQIVQIEKLEISVESNSQKTDLFFSNNEAKNDIKIQIEKQIQEGLSKLKNTSIPTEKKLKTHTLSPQEKTIKTLLHFIENGTLPWWISKGDDIYFLENIPQEEIAKESFSIPFRKLIQEKRIQKRIINQFSNDDIIFIINSLLNTKITKKALPSNNILPFINKKQHDFKQLFWQMVFDFMIDKKPEEIVTFYHKNEAGFSSEKFSFELFIKAMKSVFSFDLNEKELVKIKKEFEHSDKIKPIIRPESKNSSEKENSNSGIEKFQSKKEQIQEKEDYFHEENTNSKSCYVQNAGLIILHPFLKEMLKKCGLINDNNTISDKELAAHLLHYAATKKENDYEHAMIFEKFLCGIPMQQSIQREIKIDDNHKQQVEELLLSVVQHWSALKNTSTDVLRTEFLQREGKLDWSESNPKLTIERKTQDLLLEKIPWNINIIKIPWMDKLIYTQW